MHSDPVPSPELETPFSVSELDSLIAGTLFSGMIRYFPQLESTSITAAKEAMEGAEEGTAFIAGAQTAGRGRGGHSWHSEAGAGIYLSTVLRPRVLPGEVLWLSLAAGLAVQAAIQETTGARPDLRWPNDLLLGAKKCCGILMEMTAEPTRTRFVIAGIGINVNHPQFPPELSEVATSLRIETGRSWRREPLLGAVLRALSREYCRLLTDRDSAHKSIAQRLESSSSYVRGKPVHVDEAGGYFGTTEGLDDSGFLLVRTKGGLRTVLSGGVREAGTHDAILR